MHGWRDTDQVKSQMFAELTAWRLDAERIMNAIHELLMVVLLQSLIFFFTFREV